MLADAGLAVRPVPARLAHQTANRLRLRLDEAPDAAVARDLADRLARSDGVARARIRPNTASIIVDTLLPSEGVLQALQDGGAIRLLPPARHPPVSQVIDLGLMRADMAIGRQTGGTLDLRTVIGLALLMAAGGQMMRGKVAGPAITLAMTAYSLLAARK